jgi:hypothetical protein
MRGRLRLKKRFRARMVGRVRDYFGFGERPTWIRMPRAEETEHVMLLGDPRGLARVKRSTISSCRLRRADRLKRW